MARDRVNSRGGFRERQADEAQVGVRRMRLRGHLDEVELRDARRGLHGKGGANTDIGRRLRDDRPRGRRPISIEEHGRGEKLRVAMISAVSAQTTATRPHATVRQQQRQRVVVARHAHRRELSPCPRLRIPEFRHEDGAGVVEFAAGSVAADDHHIASRQDHRIGELPSKAHRGRGLHYRRAAADVDGESGRCAGAGGAVIGIGARAGGPTCHEDAALVIHGEAALLGIQHAGYIHSAVGQAACASGGDPVHLPCGTAVKETPVRGHDHLRVPMRDVTRLADHGAPVDARETPPTAGGGPTLGGVRSAAAGRGEDAAVGQRHAGIVPAGIIHIGQGGPLAGAPVEHAAQSRRIAPAIDDDAPVRQHGCAAAEHVMPRVVDLGENTRGRIPHRSIGELRAHWKRRALVRGEGEKPPVWQRRRRHRQMRRPSNDVSPLPQGNARCSRRRRRCHDWKGRCQRLRLGRKLVGETVIIHCRMPGARKQAQGHRHERPAREEGGQRTGFLAQGVIFWNFHKINSHNLEQLWQLRAIQSNFCHFL